MTCLPWDGQTRSKEGHEHTVIRFSAVCICYVWRKCKLVGMQFFQKHTYNFHFCWWRKFTIKVLLCVQQSIFIYSWQWRLTHQQHAQKTFLCFRCQMDKRKRNSVTLYVHVVIFSVVHMSWVDNVTVWTVTWKIIYIFIFRISMNTLINNATFLQVL